jgi:hypothetical protein
VSKDSKPRDLWRHVFAAAHDRPGSWCKSCGYYRVVHGAHRADCNCAAQRHRRCTGCGSPLEQPRSITLGTCLECRLIAEQARESWGGARVT